MGAPLVVVGASLAGLRAVEGARRAGWDGRVVLVGAEPHAPYDRPPLSKAQLAPGAPDVAPFRTPAELEALGVELRLGTPATGLDVAGREVHVGDDRLPCAAVVVATGAHARALPGQPLDGVHALRTLDDAAAVRAGLDTAGRVVVVGAGFIGSEVASAARDRGLPVTVVEAADAPLQRAVGTAAAGLLTALHAEAGVDLRCGAGVERLEGRDGHVVGVHLTDGTRLPADLVVVGIGAQPATGWLAGSAVPVDDGVVCGGTLEAAPGVYAAGDVARVDGVRREHWTSAAEQGALAGANAVARLTGTTLRRYGGVASFWSETYGHTLQMVGAAVGDDVEVVGGAPGPWLVLYRDGDRLAGALSLDLPGRIMKFRALLTRGAAFADAVALARAVPLPAGGRRAG